MHQRNRQAAEQPQGHEALLAIVEAIVLEGERQPREDALGICEIEPVIDPVGRSLGFRSAKGDPHIVYTFRSYIKVAKCLRWMVFLPRRPGADGGARNARFSAKNRRIHEATPSQYPSVGVVR